MAGRRSTNAISDAWRRLPGSIEQTGVTWPQRLFDRNWVSSMRLLRTCQRTFSVPPFLVVRRRADVRAVLEDGDTFPTIYPPDLVGDFVSAMNGDDLLVRRQILTAALYTSAQFYLGDVAADAQSRVDAVRGTGRLDLGRDLVYPVLDVVVGTYLGIPGPDAETLLRWTRDIFQAVFLDPVDFPSIHAQALESKAQFTAHVDRLVAAAADRDVPAERPAVLDVLVSDARLAPPVIRDNLIGLAIGWLWHGARAPLIVMDELLKRPDVLASARAAACAEDVESVRRITWEILRFRPVQIGLVRGCTRDIVLAPNTHRSTNIKRDQPILAATHAAMWDETAIPTPADFDPGRAEDEYLIFGAGAHRCLGEWIMRRQLPDLLMPLLKLDWLARAAGAAGRMRWVGPSPDGFEIRLPMGL